MTLTLVHPVMNPGAVKSRTVTTALKRAGFTRVRKVKGAPRFGFRVLRFGGWLSVVFTDQYGYRADDLDLSELLGYYQETLAEVGIVSWLWENQVVIPMPTLYGYTGHVATTQAEVNAALRRDVHKFDGSFGYVLADGFNGVIVAWSEAAKSFRMACRISNVLRERNFDAEPVEIEEGEWVSVVTSRKDK